MNKENGLYVRISAMKEATKVLSMPENDVCGVGLCLTGCARSVLGVGVTTSVDRAEALPTKPPRSPPMVKTRKPDLEEH